MRIGIDCRKIADFGIGTYIEGLLGGLAAIGTRDTFVLFGPPEIAPMIPEGLPVEHVHASAPHYSIRELVVIGRAARKARLGVFHAPHYVVPFVSGPVVVTVHDLIHLKRPSGNPLAPIYARRMIGRAVRRSAAIVTVTEAVAAEIAAAFPHATPKLEVVPNGVVAEFFSERHPDDEARIRELGLEGDGYFLFVGNDKPHKNVDGLVRAWSLVRDGLPAMRLALVGCSPDRFRVEDRVSTFGFVDRSLLALLYRCASALVQPSFEEGFGLPVAEAMASGTPVICSDIAPLREVAGDAGRYVPAGDPAALRDAMLQVARAAGIRDTMIRAGRSRASALRWTESATRTAAIYARAAAGK